MSPTLVITRSSPFGSPRPSPKTSPHVSPRNSPRNSPRSSPFASPTVSPRNSPVVSPSNSPVNSPCHSPLVLRKGPPPPPPPDSDEDSPPAVPERKYKSRVGNHGKKVDKSTYTLGYIDIDKTALTESSTNSLASMPVTNYAELAYPAPGTTQHGLFPEINDKDSTYDTPLPILTVVDSQHNKVLKENGLASKPLEPVAEPFADDPFQIYGFESPEWPMSAKDFDNDAVAAAYVERVMLPPRLPSREQPCDGKSFSKARSTDNVIDVGNYNATIADSKSSVNCSTPDISDLPSSNSNTLQHKKSTRHVLVTRNSWAGPDETCSYTNSSYGTGFDPSKLEGKLDGSEEDDEIDKEDMQFYEEDFQILEAQGYTRDEIKRALIVAENNFAMARKILREFSHNKKS